jgi:hypothetical protein
VSRSVGPLLNFSGMARAHATVNGAARKSNGRAAISEAPRLSYDAVKEFEGTRYTGMKIGRGHKWRWTPTITRPVSSTRNL